MNVFRFVTYNIRKGKGASGRRDGSVAQLGDALAPYAPDLVLCQEVFHAAQGIEQSVDLGAALGLQPIYEANRVRRHGRYGNATLSRFSVDAVRNHDVSTNALERRGVLYCRLDLGGRPLHVFNAHLGLNQRQRSLQIRHIQRIIASTCGAAEPVLLAGDFNDWNRRLDRFVTHKMGLQNVFAHLHGRAGLTWHARRPVFNLDRVYVRHLRPKQTQRFAGAPWDQLSDHFPLWAELEVL